MSGAATRDSIHRKTASSATAPASSPSVSADVQPFWLPLTIAYTASISAAVTVIAPPTSSRPAPIWPPPPGSSRSDRITTAMPIGMLTRKIQCQSSVSVRMPPSSTPIEPPPEATKPNTPIAFARSAGSVKRVIISESATADATAPPTPCTARAAMSRPWEVARPQHSDATVNSVIPARNSRRWPYRSPRRPPRSRKPPNVSR